jgi:UDP-N-acetylglucosamine acyltransferase
VTIAGGVQLGGHVRVDERVTIGGNGGVHQDCRIGRGAMLSGGVPTTGDVAPFFMLTGFNVVSGPNVVGIRRQELAADVIDDIRWTYKVIYRRRLPPDAALEALRERAGRPMVDEYIEFIETSKRGLCRAGSLDTRSQTQTEPAAVATDGR